MGAVFRVVADKIEEFAKLMPHEYLYSENTIVYGMTDDGNPCAVALLELEDLDVSISYLYVNSDDNFVMYNFINTIAYDMAKQGVERLIWKYLADENDRRKLANLGFETIPGEGAVFEFSIKELSAVKLLNVSPNNTISLKEISAIELKKLCNEIKQENKDIVDMPIQADKYLGDCSVVYMEDNIPKGIMLLQSEDGMLQIPYIYSKSKNPMAIIDMIRFMYSNAKKIFDKNIICKAYVTNNLLAKIIEKLIGVKGKYQYIGIRNVASIAQLEEKIISEYDKKY